MLFYKSGQIVWVIMKVGSRGLQRGSRISDAQVIEKRDGGDRSGDADLPEKYTGGVRTYR